MLYTLIAFICMLVVLILVHELGHFFTAKMAGVKVIEFGIGFPPKLWSFKWGETEYSINAVPLGGFNKLAGEEDPSVERSLASKHWLVRIIVLLAGSVMNLLLPLVLFSVAFMVPHTVTIDPVVVQEIAVNSPAELAGIEIGDQLVSIADRPVQNISDPSSIIQGRLGQEIAIELVTSEGVERTVELVPRWQPPANEGSIGIMINVDYALANRTEIRESEPFWVAIPHGFRECFDAFRLFKNEIINWVLGTIQPQVVGPVAIAQITGEVARTGFSQFLQLAAFISINLGIVNLLPFPALDGGRIVFVLVEVLRRGKRISPRIEGIVHFAGFALLIGFMLAVTFQDILNIVTGAGPIP